MVFLCLLGGSLDIYDPVLPKNAGTVLRAIEETTGLPVTEWAQAITGTSYSESSPVGDIVAISWDAMSESAVAFGQVLHVLGVDTGTTTGATKDDTAAAISATGWTCHLHVTAVSSGSWVVTVDDSANGTDWATIATFTAATGATSQRLVSAAATTAVRRYVRYVATATGGSTPTITFALAYARTRA